MLNLVMPDRPSTNVRKDTQLPILLVPSSYDPSNPEKAGAKTVTETTLGELLPMSFGPGESSETRLCEEPAYGADHSSLYRGPQSSSGLAVAGTEYMQEAELLHDKI